MDIRKEAFFNKAKLPQSSVTLTNPFRKLQTPMQLSRARSQRRLCPIAGRTLAEENLRNLNTKSKTSQKIALAPCSPQRVGLPLYFNTPIRKDDLLDSRRYSEKLSARLIRRRANNPNFLNNESVRNMSYMDSIDPIQHKKRLKDYSILAFACKRASNYRNEGRACYSCGVLHDNLGQHLKAVRWYEKFLAICQRIGDSHGLGLAYNCIGVSYQKLGEENRKYYRKAIEYHKKHFQHSEVKDKFIASMNLGLVYGLVGDKENADVYNKEALVYAAQVSSLSGQTVVIGNLGRIGTSMIRDMNGLRAYAEKYLALSFEVRHKAGEAEAHMRLGRIEQTVGDHAKSVEDFAKARKIARELGNAQWESEASVMLGIAKAEVNWKNKANDILKTIDSKESF